MSPLGQGMSQQPYAIYPLQMVFGAHGYFEVTPSGSLVFYPVWSSIEPEVMHTIFAMMGAMSVVGRSVMEPGKRR